MAFANFTWTLSWDLVVQGFAKLSLNNRRWNAGSDGKKRCSFVQGWASAILRFLTYKSLKRIEGISDLFYNKWNGSFQRQPLDLSVEDYIT